jgi:hypothetical protein
MHMSGLNFPNRHRATKTFITEYILIIASFLLIGICSYIVFLKKDRDFKVTVSNSNGKELHRWVSDGEVKVRNGCFEFKEKFNNTKMKISGGIIVIEEFEIP